MNTIESVDTSIIENLQGLMKDRFNFLIETFFNTTTMQLNELQAAIDNNQAEKIIELTHAIKGSSAAVGAISVQALGKEYEDNARAGKLDDIADWSKLLEIEFKRYQNDVQSYL